MSRAKKLTEKLSTVHEVHMDRAISNFQSRNKKLIDTSTKEGDHVKLMKGMIQNVSLLASDLDMNDVSKELVKLTKKVK